MPSTTQPQAVKMAIACHEPGKVKGKKIPKKVACEFNAADKKTGILKGRRKKRETVKHRGKRFTFR